jgi:hypothetical protein
MKKIIFASVTIAAIIFSACNNSDKTPKPDDMSKMDEDTAQTTTQSDADIAAVTPAFDNLDANISTGIKNIVSHYLQIKNALVNDDSKEAASQGKAMAERMGRLDKSFFTPEQKKIYDGVEEGLKEHAEHIGENAGNITHQRENFSMMSQDVYDLAKAFGGGRTLYHDHCPMYDDNKGAMWLSETKEIKNPYYGDEMLACGKVEEKIQ